MFSESELYENIQKLKYYEDSEEFLEASDYVFNHLEESMPYLIQEMKTNPSDLVRRGCVKVLSYFRDPNTVDDLKEFISLTSNHDLRIEAFLTLAQIGSDSAMEALFSVFDIKEHHRTNDLVFFIARKFAERALLNLKGLFYHHEEWVREKAALCLVYMNCDVSDLYNELVYALRSPDPSVRDAVVTVLGKKYFQTEQVREILKEITRSDPELFVKENAESILESMSA